MAPPPPVNKPLMWSGTLCGAVGALALFTWIVASWSGGPIFGGLGLTVCWVTHGQVDTMDSELAQVYCAVWSVNYTTAASTTRWYESSIRYRCHPSVDEATYDLALHPDGSNDTCYYHTRRPSTVYWDPTIYHSRGVLRGVLIFFWVVMLLNCVFCLKLFCHQVRRPSESDRLI